MIVVFELASSQALGNVNQLLDHDHQELYVQSVCSFPRASISCRVLEFRQFPNPMGLLWM
jgi:hypothetical protein